MKITPKTQIFVMSETAANITTDAINRIVDTAVLDAIIELFRASLYYRNGKINQGQYDDAISLFEDLRL